MHANAGRVIRAILQGLACSPRSSPKRNYETAEAQCWGRLPHHLALPSPCPKAVSSLTRTFLLIWDSQLIHTSTSAQWGLLAQDDLNDSAALETEVTPRCSCKILHFPRPSNPLPSESPTGPRALFHSLPGPWSSVQCLAFSRSSVNIV